MLWWLLVTMFNLIFISMSKNKNRLSFEANLSRHPHDISSGYTSSLSTGMIVPQWFDIAQPGDKYIFNVNMFSRFQNIQKAFLGEVDIHVKFFFVPLQMIYTAFGQIFAQTNDVISSSFKSLGTKDTFPHLYPNDVINSSDGPQNYYIGHKECLGKETARLFDAFNINPYGVLNASSRNLAGYNQETDNPDNYNLVDLTQTDNPLIAPWIPAAYQAIYQKFFRNDEFEKFDIQSYNVDQYYETDSVDVVNKFFKLRYCQRSSDYFTKVRVSPIASFINKLSASASDSENAFVNNASGGSLSSLLSKTQSWLGYNEYNLSSGANPTTYNTNNQEGASAAPSGFEFGSPIFSSSTQHDMPYGLNVSNIRAAFALDKFLRVYGRAGKTYDDQILAHFGIKIPHDVKHDATEICHFRSAIQADPVYASATIGADASGSSVLGDVGGQASGTLTGKSSFKAPVHGVIMAVAYAVTKPRYFGTFSKLHCLSSRIDFPIPEFDKLGAQPMYSWEINPNAGLGNTLDSSVQRIGWQNRYQQFKEKYNRVSFTYAKANAFGEEQSGDYVEENAFQPWVLSRAAFKVEADYDATMTAIQLWESPNALNSIMDLPYNGAWSNTYFFAPHLMFQTDPLITEFYCDCTKVSWMSPTGEPDL